MAETMYAISEIANPDNVITCNWQNAFELVNHGFWKWAKGNGSKEFRRAQADAKGNPDPRGFEHLSEVPDTAEDDDDMEPYVPPARVAPQPAPKPTVANIADTKVPEAEDGLEDMSREELFAEAEKHDIKVDKRTGTKNLISLIRTATGAE